MNTPDQPTAPGYSGLSKQEVAERLKQPAATRTLADCSPQEIEKLSAQFAGIEPTTTATPIYRFSLASWLSIYGRTCLMDFVKETDYATLERELSSAQAALAAAKADNESLRTLWTEIRTVLIQSRAANCVCSYGAQQADAVEAANAALNRMPPDVTGERDQLRAALAAAKE